MIVLSEKETSLELNELRDWAKNRMPRYSLPTVLKIMEELPRNAMGKVNKKELIKIAFSD